MGRGKGLLGRGPAEAPVTLPNVPFCLSPTNVFCGAPIPCMKGPRECLRGLPWGCPHTTPPSGELPPQLSDLGETDPCPGGLGTRPQHSPKSLEHICSIMPSALCSISHWVQILDTAVRDQLLSQLPAADTCPLGQLLGDTPGRTPAAPLLLRELCWGNAGRHRAPCWPGSSPRGEETWGHLPIRWWHFEAQQQ